MVTGNLGCVKGTLAVKNFKQQVPEVDRVSNGSENMPLPLQ